MKNINFKIEDKNQIREDLISFMEKNPVREKGFARYINWKPVFPTLQLKMQFMPTKIVTAALLAALLFGTGATALAAEGSLPGDTLYPVQEASEKVRGWMKFNPESKAEWHAKMTEKRLTELDQLVFEGKITEEQKTKLEEKVDDRIEMANKQFEKMKERGEAGGALGIASKIENSLEARENIFRRAGNAFGKLADKDAEFAEKFQDKADKMAEKRGDMEEKIKSDNSEKMKSATEGTMKAAEKIIAEVKKYIEDNKSEFEEGDVASALAKLAEAQTAHENGTIMFGDGEYGRAFVSFTTAHRLAQQAKMLATGKNPKPIQAAKPFLQKIKPFGLFKKLKPATETQTE
ncbi:hypothetical protein KJ885_00725 [Patescibacteria group bacterium]|nr:hypothetical protein [Patescibacteria group bacterium]